MKSHCADFLLSLVFFLFFFLTNFESTNDRIMHYQHLNHTGAGSTNKQKGVE